MKNLNLSATLNLFRLMQRPNLCLPHAIISRFDKLPVPLDEAFTRSSFTPGKIAEDDETWRCKRKGLIKAIVLDKDNCFALPHHNEIHESCKSKFDELKYAYGVERVLIVSNTAGSRYYDPTNQFASEVERTTGVKVLCHVNKKPGCGLDIFRYFSQRRELGVQQPDQIAIIGDRLLTDVMLANMMGSFAIWIKEGLVPWEENSVFARLEQKLAISLLKRGYHAPETSHDPIRSFNS